MSSTRARWRIRTNADCPSRLGAAPSQDNSEVHFKVKHTTKFEKVRAPPRALRLRPPRAPRRPPPLLFSRSPLTPPRSPPAPHPPRARSSTPSAPASLSRWTPCASSSTARASCPTKPRKTCVRGRSDGRAESPDPAKPADAPKTPSSNRVIVRGVPTFLPVWSPPAFVRRPRPPAPAPTPIPTSPIPPSLPPAARHGRRRLHRRDDGAGRRLLSARAERRTPRGERKDARGDFEARF